MYLAAQPGRLAMSFESPVLPAESTVSISRISADTGVTLMGPKRKGKTMAAALTIETELIAQMMKKEQALLG